jgi:hypothetical protein
VNARQTKAQSAVKKCEADVTKAQQKQQTAAAKQVHNDEACGGNDNMHWAV